MKPPTVFLGEMTSPEVEAFLADHDTVIVPTGSTEQHGPHGPLLTDVLVPKRSRAASRRASAPLVAPADQLRAVLPARRVHRARPHPDPDVHGPGRGPVRVAVVDRLPADRLPQRALRQHLRDRLRVRERRRSPAPGRPRFPINYWDGMTRGRGGRVLRADHRPARQPGRDVRGDGDQPRPRRPRRTPTPRCRRSPRSRTRRRSTRRSSSRLRARSTARRIPARGATPASPRGISASATSRSSTEATFRMLGDIERTFAAMPDR